jgi:hypothetical protein
MLSVPTVSTARRLLWESLFVGNVPGVIRERPSLRARRRALGDVATTGQDG